MTAATQETNDSSSLAVAVTLAGVVGIDLSGPANPADTSAMAFDVRDGRLTLAQRIRCADDARLLELVAGAAVNGPIAVGIDAPLSYNMGGGDRPGDRRLRKRLIHSGMLPGSVMAPTLTRMAYLTLRGIALARMLGALAAQDIRIAEIHPIGSLALRGCPVADIRRMKRDPRARQRILQWLEHQGLLRIGRLEATTDHDVAACAAALGAWKWAGGDPVWIEPATPPAHPFDYAC